METNEPGDGRKGFPWFLLRRSITGKGSIGRTRLLVDLLILLVLAVFTAGALILFPRYMEKVLKEVMYACYIHPHFFTDTLFEPDPDAPVPVSAGDLYGYQDRDGNMVIEPRYAYASNFHEGRASVAIDHNDYRYLLKHYDSDEAQTEAWKSNFEAGIIDESGNMVWSYPSLDAMPSCFSEGRASICIQGKYGFIDRDGNMVIEPRYDLAYAFREGNCCVMLKGKYGMIDTDGNYLMEPVLDDICVFSEGLAAACIESKYGFFDHSGTWVIEPQYDGAGSFSNGTAVIWNEQEQKSYRIDKAGNIVE